MLKMYSVCDIYAPKFQKCVVVMLGPSGAWEEAESIPFYGVEERSPVGVLHLGRDLIQFRGPWLSHSSGTAANGSRQLGGFSGHQRASVGGNGGWGGAHVLMPDAGASQRPWWIGNQTP